MLPSKGSCENEKSYGMHLFHKPSLWLWEGPNSLEPEGRSQATHSKHQIRSRISDRKNCEENTIQQFHGKQRCRMMGCHNKWVDGAEGSCLPWMDDVASSGRSGSLLVDFISHLPRLPIWQCVEIFGCQTMGGRAFWHLTGKGAGSCSASYNAQHRPQSAKVSSPLRQ